MSTVNSSQISTKDNIITSSTTGLLAGAGFALAGYNSRPYLKDGVISDAFVKNVESSLANKLPGGSINKKLIESFNGFIDDIGKAPSYSKIAEANYKFFNKISPDKSFNGMKEIIKQSMVNMMRIVALPDSYMTDVMLDYYIDVGKAKNPKDLKNAITYYFEGVGTQFDDFNEARASLKESFAANKNILLGLDPDMSIKEAAESLLDVRSGKFVKNPENGISKNIFKVITDTAKNMQWKTAGLWGGLGAAIFGGAMFLIQKLSTPKAKPMKAPLQSQISPQANAAAKSQVQTQATVLHQPLVHSEAKGNTQTLAPVKPQQMITPQAQVTQPKENTEQVSSTNLLKNYKKG